MTGKELKDNYFDWICQLVCDESRSKRILYRKLLHYLHDVTFNYTIAMDSNREADGIDLRYRFGYENSYDDPVITSCLDDRPCSVLEMMIALAIRCEEHIMDDPAIGNRAGQWFWGMIDNLGLGSMVDSQFESQRADIIIDRFLKRQYKKDGTGGLFTVRHCRYDLRSVEIWYQMCWYLDEIA